MSRALGYNVLGDITHSVGDVMCREDLGSLTSIGISVTIQGGQLQKKVMLNFFLRWYHPAVLDSW